MIKIKGLKEAGKVIRGAREIVISGHVNPDGDSIGSLLSLGLGLESLGKRVHMLCCDEVPKRYMLLPGARRIIKSAQFNTDLAISVDCSSKEILGPAYNSFELARNILEIDHHIFRRPFGNYLLLDSAAASVGEIIFILLKELRVAMTRDIAQNLITSIIVETNSFRSPGVRPFTFKVCSELMKDHVNFYKLVDMVFWSKRKESVMLSGICLSRSKFLKGGRIVWSIIKKGDFKKVGGADEDVDAVPDEMRAIKNVRIAVLFREKDKKTLRVSMRSKGKINVAAIAERYSGGGHFDVAGCSIPNNARAMKLLLRQLENIAG